MSNLDHMLEPKTSVRRGEVITGSGRRRRLSADDKARFVEETLAPGGGGVGGCAAARIISATAVYVASANATAGCDPCGTRTADVRARGRYPIIYAAGTLTTAPGARGGAESSGIIELEINGVAVRVGRGADAATAAAVIRALKTCHA